MQQFCTAKTAGELPNKTLIIKINLESPRFKNSCRPLRTQKVVEEQQHVQQTPQWQQTPLLSQQQKQDSNMNLSHQERTDKFQQQLQILKRGTLR